VPDLSFWEFLKLTPEELREKLSALGDRACDRAMVEAHGMQEVRGSSPLSSIRKSFCRIRLGDAYHEGVKSILVHRTRTRPEPRLIPCRVSIPHRTKFPARFASHE
jgi:hypothetical protein